MIILDGRKMTKEKQIHDYLYKQFQVPFYYGRNLDAFWDCLMEIRRQEDIYLFHGQYMLKYLPDYGKKLIQLFQEAEEENSYLHFWTNVGKEILS